MPRVIRIPLLEGSGSPEAPVFLGERYQFQQQRDARRFRARWFADFRDRWRRALLLARLQSQLFAFEGVS